MPKQTLRIPVAARRALGKLGADISAARRRRRLPLEVLAERALTTRQTISRIEKGDPGVAMGTWATVLFALGLGQRIGDLAAPAIDELGLTLEEERLPIRVRTATRPAHQPGRVNPLPETGTGSRPTGSRADPMKRGTEEMTGDGNPRDDR